MACRVSHHCGGRSRAFGQQRVESLGRYRRGSRSWWCGHRALVAAFTAAVATRRGPAPQRATTWSLPTRRSRSESSGCAMPVQAPTSSRGFFARMLEHMLTQSLCFHRRILLMAYLVHGMRARCVPAWDEGCAWHGCASQQACRGLTTHPLFHLREMFAKTSARPLLQALLLHRACSDCVEVCMVEYFEHGSWGTGRESASALTHYISRPSMSPRRRSLCSARYPATNKAHLGASSRPWNCEARTMS